jgi:hypothetical protein
MGPYFGGLRRKHVLYVAVASALSLVALWRYASSDALGALVALMSAVWVVLTVLYQSSDPDIDV